MEQETFEHLLYRFYNAPIATYPYPHFHIENIFPNDFYREILENLPELNAYVSLSDSGAVKKGSYRERYILPFQEPEISRMSFVQGMFWRKFALRLKSAEWIRMLLDKFDPFIRKRYGDMYDRIDFFSDLGLLRDQSGYGIGPHTDHPSRALTLLFYCPQNSEQAHLGTSLYRHPDSQFKCKGHSHHRADQFTKIYTAPYVPNSVFGFIKSDQSFHGVEKIGALKEERNIIDFFLIGLEKT